MPRHWTNEEVRLLEESYGRVSTQILYNGFPGRSYQAVRQKARTLRLRPEPSVGLYFGWKKIVELAENGADKIQMSEFRREVILEIDRRLKELEPDKW